MKKQPAPKKQNNEPNVTDLVLSDLKARHEAGLKTYGVALKPFNGRNALVDLYEELLDSVLYLRQLLHEEQVERNSMTFEELLVEYNSLAESNLNYAMKLDILEGALRMYAEFSNYKNGKIQKDSGQSARKALADIDKF